METTIKVQRKKLSGGGSLINHFMSNNATLPKVGEGATRMWYTDRTCYDVVEVSECGRYVKLEELNAKYGGKKGEAQMGHQDWVFEKTGAITELEWYRGAWRVVNYEVLFTEEFKKEANENGADDFYGIYIRKINPELADTIYRNVWGEQECYPQNVVEGVTRKKKCYNKINIVFGVRNYYYDWSF